MTSPSLLRSAWQRLTPRLFLQQIVLAVVSFALFALWLRVPDSTVLAVLSSAVLALVLLLLVFAGEAWLLLRLRGAAQTRPALARGAVALVIAALLLLPLSALLTHLSAGDSLRAGYLNSRFPAGMRSILSYPHLLTLFTQTWDSLFWAGAIVLTMVAVAITVALHPLGAVRRMFQSLTAWLVLSAATILGSELTRRLLHWTPGHGLGVEATSLLLRITAVTLLDAALLCLSLALLVDLAQRSEHYGSPDAAVRGGTPDPSQPRTVANP